MKKVILGVLALILSIALVIGGYLLITSQKLQSYAVEEGIPCPYSWQELRDGTFRLEIDTTAYPDYSWVVESYPKSVIAATEVSGEPGTAVFSILPLNEGETYVQVSCEQTEPFTVRVFEVNIRISVSEERKITIEETTEKVYDGIATMGENSDYPIRWWMDSNGTVNLLITEESNGNWEAAVYDPDGLDVTGPFYRQGSCGFEIQGKLEGTFALTLHDGAAKAIRLEIEVEEELTASITDFAVEDYVRDSSEQHTALESVAGGTVVLPTQAVVTDYSVTSSGGSVGFLMNDMEWCWQIEVDGTEEEFVNAVATGFAETKTATVDGVTLSAYGFADGVMVSWTDGARVMILYGERGATLTDALAVAEQIAEANHE